MRELSKAIDNNKKTLTECWGEYVKTSTDLEVMFEIYNEIAHNLPISDYYLIDDMLDDRDRYSILSGPKYIEGILEDADCDFISELSEAEQARVREVITSGYGGFTIDW